MARKWKVYIHINKVDGRKYIGITSKVPERRWQNGYGYRRSPYFFRSIQKYGWDGFIHRIVADKLTRTEAENMEMDLIKQYSTTSREFGYNLTFGGETNVPNDETRKKLSANHADLSGANNPMYGKNHSPCTKRKISLAHTGKPGLSGKDSPLYGRSGSLNPMFGRRHSAETRAKMSRNRKGKHSGQEHWLYGKAMSSETRAKLSKAHIGQQVGGQNPRSRSVVNLNTNKVFDSISEAERHYNLSVGHISNCCRGKRKSAGKHPETGEPLRWMYIEDYMVSKDQKESDNRSLFVGQG